MFTFNARLFNRLNADSRAQLIESRMSLSPSEVCDFAREISAAGAGNRTELLIETMVDGENYQAFLDREMPGATHGGFAFRATALRNADGWELEDRCQEFMDLSSSL